MKMSPTNFHVQRIHLAISLRKYFLSLLAVMVFHTSLSMNLKTVSCARQGCCARHCFFVSGSLVIRLSDKLSRLKLNPKLPTQLWFWFRRGSNSGECFITFSCLAYHFTKTMQATSWFYYLMKLKIKQQS